VLCLREEGCMVRGEIYKGSPGPAQGPAGRPEVMPVVPGGSGEGGAGGERVPAGDVRSLQNEAGDRGSREMPCVRGGKSRVDRGGGGSEAVREVL